MHSAHAQRHVASELNSRHWKKNPTNSDSRAEKSGFTSGPLPKLSVSWTWLKSRSIWWNFCCHPQSHFLYDCNGWCFFFFSVFLHCNHLFSFIHSFLPGQAKNWGGEVAKPRRTIDASSLKNWERSQKKVEGKGWWVGTRYWAKNETQQCHAAFAGESRQQGGPAELGNVAIGIF